MYGMVEKDTRRPSVIRLDGTLPEGWAVYRQGVASISQSDWSRAIELLAAAETSFSASDEFQGLWRALIGQALLHWREGAPALAVAAQLCAEIVRWQQLCDRQQIGQREAEAVIAEIQRDLLGRLHQAAASVRIAPAGSQRRRSNGGRSYPPLDADASTRNPGG